MAATAPPPPYSGAAPPPPPYGVYGNQPQGPPMGAYGPPPVYGQPYGPPPVYTCSAPAQPMYQQQPQEPMGSTYYANPPPAAYPYQQHESAIKPEFYPKQSSASAGGVLGQDGTAGVDDDKIAITPDLDISIRHAFVRKVYAILSVQLLMTFGLATAFSLSSTLATWLIQYWWIYVIGLLVSVVCMLVLCCVPNLGRRFPINFILLTIITLGFALAICVGAATSTSYAFFIACAITAAVVIGLTIFAIQVKYDFTGCGPYILVMLIILIVFGIFAIIFSNRIVQCVYAGLSAVLFSFLLVYDTQRVVGGKHRRYQYSIDDYVFAALTLYIDIVTLFMDILALVQNT